MLHNYRLDFFKRLLPNFRFENDIKNPVCRFNGASLSEVMQKKISCFPCPGFVIFVSTAWQLCIYSCSMIYFLSG